MITKSKYTRYNQCPKMLWLDKYKKQEAEQDPEKLRRFAVGHEVGDLAKSLLGYYVEATAYNADGSLDIGRMLRNTRKYVLTNAENICEAAFSARGCYCAVDILHKADSGYAIYEVKSSTGVSDVYVMDVAFQKYVLEHGGLKITGTYVVHIDNTYTRQGALDIHKLFKIVDVSDEIAPYYAEVAAKVAEAENYLKQKTEPPMRVGARCNNPYACDYFKYCTRNMPQPNVFDLYRINFETACGYAERGLITFEDILNSGVKLNEKQQRQAETAAYDKPMYFDRDGVQKFLNGLWYPLYFLDFETFREAVPRFDGQRPYEKIPFQYSLDYIAEEGAALCHKEFLADENSDPRRDIAQSLVDNIPENACIIAYNMSFEQGRIEYLAGLFPDLAQKLMKLHGNFMDLLDVFQGGLVYNKAMDGSFSLKSVLPAMFPNDPELDYHGLADVHDGGEAESAYLSLRSLDGGARESLRQSLLKYCGLDTLAMVKLWQKLRELCV